VYLVGGAAPACACPALTNEPQAQRGAALGVNATETAGDIGDGAPSQWVYSVTSCQG